MITNKTETIEVENQVPESISCDVCKTKYYYGDLQDDMQIQEFHHIRFIGGYDSIFGDGVPIQCDICQKCLKEKLGDYLISATEVDE
jgi:hypothetical protein